jgi:hypothetical protein
MIENLQENAVASKISNESDSNPILKKICDYISHCPRPYKINPSSSGLDVSHPSNSRLRLKIWRPSDTELLAWFYKTSAIPHSRDRYSYGGVVLPIEDLDFQNLDSELEEWLLWLDSGFNTDKRPSSWTGAFTYDIPL